jgi:hypothetical protein
MNTFTGRKANEIGVYDEDRAGFWLVIARMISFLMPGMEWLF